MSFWKGRTVFLTGGTGFLGWWLAQALVEEGADVTALVRDVVPNAPFFKNATERRVNVVHGALEDYGVAPGCQADLVVFDASSKADVLRINPACTHVFKRGKLVAETAPAASTVMGKPVDFVLRS